MKAKKKTIRFDSFYEVSEISYAVATFLNEHPDTPNKLVLRSFLDSLRVVCYHVEFVQNIDKSENL